MKVKYYRKKPVIIQAIQLKKNDESIKDCLEFLGSTYKKDLDINDELESIYMGNGININTLEGVHHASFGDYIIKGVKGEFYPCKPDIFKNTYEAV